MSSPGTLAGRVAVVTGAGQGIGRAIAHRYAAAGARVVIAELLPEFGGQTAREIMDRGGEASFVQADVTEPAQIEGAIRHAVATYGRLDVLVNNARWNKGGTAVTLPLEDWNKAMAAMVTAVFLGAKYAVPEMEKSGGGCIISLSSVHGLLAAANTVVYETAKAAVIHLTKAMAVDFGPLGIRVNAICPGLVVHERHDRVAREAGQPSWRDDPYRAGLRALEYPIGRWGSAEDIAGAALFLASDDAAFVTGHALVVDGGMTVQLQDSLARRLVSYVETASRP